MNEISLVPLSPNDREQFVLDNQEAFNFGALEEFGQRSNTAYFHKIRGGNYEKSVVNCWSYSNHRLYIIITLCYAQFFGI